jgi:hypothetical protein
MSALKDKDFKKAASEQPAEETVNFSAWFAATLKQRKLQPHHMDTIRALFSNHGLSESETASEYEAALKHFGF